MKSSFQRACEARAAMMDGHRNSADLERWLEASFAEHAANQRFCCSSRFGTMEGQEDMGLDATNERAAAIVDATPLL